MTTSFYLFLISLLGIAMFIGYKYWKNKNEIDSLDRAYLDRSDNLADVKDLVFAFLDDISLIVRRRTNIFLHFILHIFVIVLGFISDVFDYIYSKARDMFLVTATKEREVVTKFWPHLKEYKKEKEGEME